jgi:hypothetical protein
VPPYKLQPVFFEEFRFGEPCGCTGTLIGRPYFDARRSMSRHMYASFIGLVAKGMLFISCIIARALKGRDWKRQPNLRRQNWPSGKEHVRSGSLADPPKADIE